MIKFLKYLPVHTNLLLPTTTTSTSTTMAFLFSHFQLKIINFLINFNLSISEINTLKMSTSSINSVPSTVSGSRGTPVHMSSLSPAPYKPLLPSASVAAIFKTSDDELRHRGIEDLVRVIRYYY